MKRREKVRLVQEEDIVTLEDLEAAEKYHRKEAS